MSFPKLYTTYEHQNIFTESPILEDWDITKEWNKIHQLKFKSPSNLKEGTHIKLEIPGHTLFGGQIVKKELETNEYTKYEALDYKRYLMTEVIYSNPGSITSADVLRKFKPNENNPIKYNISNTKNMFGGLKFDGVSFMEMITSLMGLEFDKKTLIFFDVDANANFTYKIYPGTISGYSIDKAFSFSQGYDYTNIITGWRLFYGYGPQESYTNKDLEKIWGRTQVVKNIEVQNNSVSTIGPSPSYSDYSPEEENEIVESVVDVYDNSGDNPSVIDNIPVNYGLGGYGGIYGSSEELSMEIHERLSDKHIINRVISYHGGLGHKQYSVQIKKHGDWKDFDYSGLDKVYQPFYNKKGLHVEIEYKPIRGV
jgi:hypothetical protein